MRNRVLCFVALGANLPSGTVSPAETLEKAAAMIAARGFRPLARSRWWLTPAQPSGSGPDFVNGAMACESPWPPARALAELHAVEDALGRARPARWAPRVCDLDLIACGDAALPYRETVARWMALGDRAGSEPPPAGLVLPHPRMHERGFVLAPLAEIAPDWRHPLTGRTVREMLADLPAEALEGVAPLPGPPLHSLRRGDT